MNSPASSLPLAQYTAEVNALAEKRVETIRAEHLAGKRLFGCSPHKPRTESQCAQYHGWGWTPKQVVKDIVG
jgi:hypothetical protein